MTELRDFLVAVTNRYHETGNAADAAVDVLVGQGVITNENSREVSRDCPYCDQLLGEPELDYDLNGYSTATRICSRCGAVLISTRYPPKE